MKLFTVKDFITYNNPCFSCGEKIVFTFNDINPIIDGNYCIINLIIAYSNKTAITLKVNLKTNKFQTNNIKGLKTYTETMFPLEMISECTKCRTQIQSDALEFDFDKHVIRPCKSRSEYLRVEDKKLQYTIYASPGRSMVAIRESSKGPYILDLEVNKGEMFLYKIKTREKLIQKLRTYLTFS